MLSALAKPSVPTLNGAGCYLLWVPVSAPLPHFVKTIFHLFPGRSVISLCCCHRAHPEQSNLLLSKLLLLTPNVWIVGGSLKLRGCGLGKKTWGTLPWGNCRVYKHQVWGPNETFSLEGFLCFLLKRVELAHYRVGCSLAQLEEGLGST